MTTQVLAITRQYITSTGRRGVCYTFKGRKCATFIPTNTDNVVEHLLGRLGLAQAKTLAELVDELEYDREDFQVSLWERYGKSRIYVDLLQKSNGGKRWNGGLGYSFWVDTKTGRVMGGSWAGAKTRNAWEEDVDALTEQILELIGQ